MKKLRLFLATFLLSVSAILPATASLVHATTFTCTWTGATNNNFSTTTNWSNCNSAAPTTGDSLIFDNTSLTSSKTPTNDITGLSVANITFQGTNSNGYSFSISGNSITVTSGITASAQVFSSMSNNLILGGNVALSGPSSGELNLTGVISGTGNVTVTSGDVDLAGNNTFTGTVTANSGSTLIGETAAAFGTTTDAVTVASGASLWVGNCNAGFTFPYPLTLSGTGNGSTPTLVVGSGCSGGSSGADVSYALPSATTQTFSLSGAVTLGSNIKFGGVAQTTTLTGALSGAYSIALSSVYGGQLVINSSNNTSGQANGTLSLPPIVQTLSDSLPSTTVFIGTGATITITGARSDTEVGSGGTLKGSGTVGALSVDTGGTVAPGDAPACLSSGNLTLNGTYNPEIDGTTACTGYDQLKVNGTVTISGATLSPTIVSGFKPAAGQSYEIINNLGGNPISGTFTGLAEGATFTVSGYTFKISYKGAGGNNVVLTVVSAPGTPNTGFSTIAAHPAQTLGVSLVASGILFGLAIKNKKRLAFARSKATRK